MGDILGDVDRVVMPGMTHWNHPGFFAYFTSSAGGPGILGEMLAAALSPNCMLWRSCPSGTELEQATLGWVRDALGLPGEYWGAMYEGASTSSMHAVAAAREQLGDLRVRELGMAGRAEVPRLRLYASEHAHSSIDRAAVTLGLGLAGVRKVACDAEYRMRPDALAHAVAEDRRAGWRPFCVVATAGTTSCTSVDPLAEIADLCGREELWLHVDAAHGGSLALLPEHRGLFAGWERADSIVVNPHKWMFVPLDLSVLFTRKPEVLRRAFALVPEYLRAPEGGDVENYMDYGVPLGRRFRALKLWFTMRYFGVEGLAERLRAHVAMAREFASWVDADPNFERVAPVPMSTVCFRARPAGAPETGLDALNERLMAAVNRTGEAFITHTALDGQIVLRLVVSHLRTERRHVRRAWELLRRELDAIVVGERQ